jgi:hypothetical protein
MSLEIRIDGSDSSGIYATSGLRFPFVSADAGQARPRRLHISRAESATTGGGQPEHAFAGAHVGVINVQVETNPVKPGPPGLGREHELTAGWLRPSFARRPAPSTRPQCDPHLMAPRSRRERECRLAWRLGLPPAGLAVVPWRKHSRSDNFILARLQGFLRVHHWAARATQLS